MTASKIPTTPDAWMSRKDAAEALTEMGLPTSEKTLQTAATRDPTMPYRVNAKRAEHQWGPTVRWRQSLVRYHGPAGDAAQPQQAA
jgi:hypothetical protein